MTEPRVSVIVPVRNGAPYLSRCVTALLAQDLPRDQFEIVLVDNNSTDRSRAVARSFDGVRVLDEPKVGAYAARNRGIAEARGDLVVFTDADCVPESSWLLHHARAMSDPGVEAVLGSRHPARRSPALRLMTLYEETKAAAIFAGDDRDLYYGYTNNMSVRRQTLMELGGFHEVMRGADSVFIRQLIDRRGADCVSYCRDAGVMHLEITALRHWYVKHAIYGRSNQLNSRRAVTCRPMNAQQRWRMYRAAVHAHGLDPASSVALLGVLVGGGVSYEIGRLAARLGSRE